MAQFDLESLRILASANIDNQSMQMISLINGDQ